MFDEQLIDFEDIIMFELTVSSLLLLRTKSSAHH